MPPHPSRVAHAEQTFAWRHVLNTTHGAASRHTTQLPPKTVNCVSTSPSTLHVGHVRRNLVDEAPEVAAAGARAHSCPKRPHAEHAWPASVWFHACTQRAIVQRASCGRASRWCCPSARFRMSSEHSSCPWPYAPHVPHLWPGVVCDRGKRQPATRQQDVMRGALRCLSHFHGAHRDAARCG